jgi:hypothetical protein
MLATNDPTNVQWNVAHQLASDLVKSIPTNNDKISDSEVRQALSYLRIYLQKDPDNAANNFLKVISNLTTAAKKLNDREQHNRGGNRNRTKLTAEKYQAVSDCCTRCLTAYKNDARSMLTILCWAVRLMKYYHQAPLGEGIDEPIVLTILSERQAEIAQVLGNRQFAIGQEIEANVTKITGIHKVTYQILGMNPLTEKEPKNINAITKAFAEDRVVTVKVVALKEDGRIKSVKYLR